MNSSTEIPAPEVRAYQDSDFHIDGQAPFVMRIGQTCDALLALYLAAGAQSCAYISACNPHGESASGRTNDERHGAFIRMLQERGIDYLGGQALDPRGKYPPEPGCLIAGLTLDAAKALGNELRQNAIVFCGAERIPALVLLR
ncbi:DUF3293 domain-containing protein [Massilia sp. PAMC28688]|uniref:DUF3293 domain-containing protein n=1 Tax=Massilia sp. PAMC28688 TaxID=2861283 RepID=UPI001C62EC60|nr:DUF3293 domain-containing protein [Massilia sp. PAMC28688]QYF93906.1 DUF3293 domain-containing protein [Massilia sp. PAMC28688]